MGKIAIKSRTGFDKWYSEHFKHLKVNPEKCQSFYCNHKYKESFSPLECIHETVKQPVDYNPFLPKEQKIIVEEGQKQWFYADRVKYFSSCVSHFAFQQKVPSVFHNQELSWYFLRSSCGFGLEFQEKDVVFHFKAPGKHWGGDSLYRLLTDPDMKGYFDPDLPSLIIGENIYRNRRPYMLWGLDVDYMTALLNMEPEK